MSETTTPAQPPKKTSKVKPAGKLPDGFGPRRWALWKYELKWDEKKGRWQSAKPTYSPKTLRSFRWREEDGHWEKNEHLFGTFEEALKAYREKSDRFDGIGYVLEPEVPVPGTEDLYPVVTDIDGCYDEGGEVEPWAMEIVGAQDTFTESSPSGEGLHLIGFGRKTPGSKMVFRVDDRKIENYGGGVGERRFVTYTGAALKGYDKPLVDVQGWIDENVPKRGSGSGAPAVGCWDLAPEIPTDTKAEIVRICESVGHKDRGELFKRLFRDGDWSSWPSRSEAEIWLLNLLAWATRYLFADPDERKSAMKALFLDSAFFRENDRPQWDREGYLDGQIDEAIAGCTSGYTGKPKEQLLRKLEALRIDHDWRLGGGQRDNPNVRAAFGAHIALAYDHGRYVRVGEVVRDPHGGWCTIPETGVLVHSSARDLSMFSGVSPTTTTTEDGEERRDYRNITKLNDRLEEMGLIKRIYRGVAWGTASMYLLPKSVVDSHEFSVALSFNTHNQEPQVGGIKGVSKREKTSGGPRLCVSSESLALTWKLNWVPDGVVSPKQKFLIEHVAWGRRAFEDLVAFFCVGHEGEGEEVEKKSNLAWNLKSRQIKPLVEKGLLAETEEGYAVDLEALQRTFVESGGEAALKGAEEAVEEERLRHHRKLREGGDEHEPGAARGNRQTEFEERIDAAIRGELDWGELSEEELLEAWYRRASPPSGSGVEGGT
jgi:hypothetical protein